MGRNESLLVAERGGWGKRLIVNVNLYFFIHIRKPTLLLYLLFTNIQRNSRVRGSSTLAEEGFTEMYI